VVVVVLESSTEVVEGLLVEVVGVVTIAGVEVEAVEVEVAVMAAGVEDASLCLWRLMDGLRPSEPCTTTEHICLQMNAVLQVPMVPYHVAGMVP
jgi:hypothetical protein